MPRITLPGVESLYFVCWRLTHLQHFCWHLKLKPKLRWGEGKKRKRSWHVSSVLALYSLRRFAHLSSLQPPSPQPSGEEPELQGGRAVCPPAQLSVVEQREVSNLVLSLCIHPTTLSYSIRKTWFYFKLRVWHGWVSKPSICDYCKTCRGATGRGEQ